MGAQRQRARGRSVLHPVEFARSGEPRDVRHTRQLGKAERVLQLVDVSGENFRTIPDAKLMRASVRRVIGHFALTRRAVLGRRRHAGPRYHVVVGPVGVMTAGVRRRLFVRALDAPTVVSRFRRRVRMVGATTEECVQQDGDSDQRADGVCSL
ncbi:MAG: hypothetical protein KDA63_14490 [Planctomycetales bacterium]|nr:hypothetical protein [Planctomycetales bacterium]